MKLLIFGASGATGTHLVAQALAKGYEVSAFVRDVRKISYSHPKLKVIQGNVADAAAVQEAVAGQDAVVSALGANGVFRFDPVVVDGLAHIVNAMTDQGVKRLVYLSTLGVKASRRGAGFMIRALAPTLLRHEIRGHEQREKIIRASSLQWTIVRAPILTNGSLTQQYRAEPALQSQQFATKLSRADVAHCLLTQLVHGRFVKKAVSLMP